MINFHSLLLFSRNKIWHCWFWNSDRPYMNLKSTSSIWSSLKAVVRCGKSLHSHQRLFKLGNGTTKTNGTNIVRSMMARRDNTRGTCPTHALQISSDDKHRLIPAIRFLRKYSSKFYAAHESLVFLCLTFSSDDYHYTIHLLRFTNI